MHKISIWFYLILLIAVLSWREVQILIDRGSWKAKDHKKLFWYIEQKGFKRLWDSFHVSNGILTFLILIIWASNSYASLIEFIIPSLADVQPMGFALDIIIYWLIWMQIRNLFMKIL